MKRKILKRLLDYIPYEFHPALFPDLPNLLYGPDLLVGGEGNLLSFFVCEKFDNGSINNLLAKMSLSRLTLPSNNKNILIVDDEVNNSRIPNSLLLNFHA